MGFLRFPLRDLTFDRVRRLALTVARAQLGPFMRGGLKRTLRHIGDGFGGESDGFRA